MSIILRSSRAPTLRVPGGLCQEAAGGAKNHGESEEHLRPLILTNPLANYLKKVAEKHLLS